MDTLYLLYHQLRLGQNDYSYVISPEEFERHCKLFARLQQGRGDTLRPELTFDDGHRSDYEFALPILQRTGLQARFFITAGWTGERTGFMAWSELRELAAGGQQIGAHGMTHKLLTHCSAKELDEELRGARLRLEDGLGQSVSTMSLPGGRSSAAVLQACWDAGYSEVFTSVPRAEPAVRAARSPIGRLNVRSSNTTAWLEQVLRPEMRLLSKLERQHQIKSVGRRILGDKLYAVIWSALNRHGGDEQAPEAPAR